MNISSRYSGLSGSAKHVKSQIAVGRKDDTVHAILEEVEEWKQKKLFWRFSDLGRRHVKLVYYFAPIKSEIFYNSDCYERVRKFVILKVHRIAIFFSQRLVNLLYSYTELSSGFLPKTSYFDLIPLFKLLKPKHPVKTSRWSNIDHFNQLSDANFVTTTVTSSKCGQNGTNQ